MQIILFSMAIVSGAFIMPGKVVKPYMYLSSLGLVFLYFFLNPPEEYDLYRHYEMFKGISEIPVSQIRLTEDTNTLIYLNRYPVYMSFLLLLSRFCIPGLLPVITGCVVYWLTIRIMFYVLDDKKNVRLWNYGIGFAVIIFGYDFISVSGIRNILAVSVFSYAIFEDLVLKKKKTVCFLVYIACCFIHTMCFVYLILRLLLILKNRFTKGILLACALFLFSFTSIYYDHLTTLFSGMKIAQTALRLFHNYTVEGGSGGAVRRGNLYVCILLYMSAFFLCIYLKKYIHTQKRYSDYIDYFLLTILFTVGSFKQYDMFVRYSMFIIPFVLVFSTEIIYQMHGKRFSLIRRGKNEAIVYLPVLGMFIIAVSILFLYHSLYGYIPAAPYFQIENVLYSL